MVEVKETHLHKCCDLNSFEQQRNGIEEMEMLLSESMTCEHTVMKCTGPPSASGPDTSLAMMLDETQHSHHIPPAPSGSIWL